MLDEGGRIRVRVDLQLQGEVVRVVEVGVQGAKEEQMVRAKGGRVIGFDCKS